MHDPVGADHPGPEGVANALVAQADPEQRDPGGEPGDQVIGDPRLQRGARTRGDDQMRWIQSLDLRHRDLIVAADLKIDAGVDLAQALDQVVSEGIVIIEDEDRSG